MNENEHFDMIDGWFFEDESYEPFITPEDIECLLELCEHWYECDHSQHPGCLHDEHLNSLILFYEETGHEPY